jgi:hypothetical protein
MGTADFSPARGAAVAAVTGFRRCNKQRCDFAFDIGDAPVRIFVRVFVA